MTTSFPQWHAPKGLIPTTPITLTLDWAVLQWAQRLAQAYQEGHPAQPDTPDAEEPFGPAECNRALLDSLGDVIAHISPAPRVRSSTAQSASDGAGTILPFRRRDKRGGRTDEHER